MLVSSRQARRLGLVVLVAAVPPIPRFYRTDNRGGNRLTDRSTRRIFNCGGGDRDRTLITCKLLRLQSVRGG